ncbi:hemolysin family protein [Lactococcus termiticola]|uniref:Hemolysin-like protein n=1 Tax=Lactococcus termiticola TaxID=2169526 RepID=A0A2R5HFV2_9LACT|nr:hemolysin family protein [Lactococcus termiticola]GBG96939.1 hemolysin-like protein [Lactococcus termiticola]
MSHPDPESLSILIQLAVLILLTALNAFFSASEMALVSLSRSRVEQRATEGDKAYANLLAVIDNPTQFLSTVQVGITFLNIVAGASLADSLAAELSPLIGQSALAQTAGKIIILVLLTFFTIVFGELFPKRVAQAMKERAALRLVKPLQWVGIILRPFIWLLTISINGLSKIIPIKWDENGDNMTRDEMEYLVSTDETALDEEERNMLAGIFSLDELLAREIMVPRTDAFMIDINVPSRKNIEAILNEAYSRVPVYDGDKDNVIGILHTKRLLKYGFENGFDGIDIRDMLQEPVFVPETINVDDLILELRRTHNQMAVLLDEYGGLVGLVTLEDMIEEIVGEIEDESDVEQKEFHKLTDTMYVVQGKMTLNDFNDEFDTHLESKDVDTIAGYFLAVTGQIPEKGEQIVCMVENPDDHLSLTSLEMDGKRVVKLRVEFLEPLVVDEEEE